MRSPAFTLRPPETPMVRRLIALLLGAYLVESLLYVASPAAAGAAFGQLALVHVDVWSVRIPHVWMLGTYGLLHEVGKNPLLDIAATVAYIVGILALFRSDFGRREPGLAVALMFAGSLVLSQLGLGAPMHVLGNVLVLWFFAGDFERRWGGGRLAAFFMGAIVAGGLLSSIVWLFAPSLTGSAVVGASGGSLALIAAFAVYYPDAQILYGFAIPIRGKHLIILSFLFDIVNLIGRADVAIVVHAGGALFGFLLTTGYWRPSKLKRRFGRPTRPASHLRVVRSDEDRWIH